MMSPQERQASDRRFEKLKIVVAAQPKYAGPLDEYGRIPPHKRTPEQLELLIEMIRRA